MMYVVCYDISDDSVRAHMSARLQDFGTRIQESVFECVLEEDGRARMLDRISRVRLAEADRVRIYRLCARCLNEVEIYGPGELTRDPDFYLV
jgi:CRISPR-associated protein Cas2